MIYKYEGNTYTAQAMQKMLRNEYRERGLRVWNVASLDEMIAHTDEYGISEVKPLRKSKHKAERHITNMIVPHEAQLLTIWQLGIPLEACIFTDDKLVAMYWGSQGDLMQYVIYSNGRWSRKIYKTNKKEIDNGN